MNENIIDIVQLNPIIEKFIGRQNIRNCNYRLMKYCHVINIVDGILLYNLITGTLVLIKKNTSIRYLLLAHNRKLIEEWYFVPEDFAEKEWCRTIQDQGRIRNSRGSFSSFVIITTFDCNARCFYCFENGIPNITMNKDTAKAVIEFITKQYSGKELQISWFGGEPLCNLDMIRYISNSLTRNGVEFHSMIHTNGYLFSDNIVQEAINFWNLRKANITIDGTEGIYNKTKNYIYRDTNPFKTVINNIDILCRSGVSVKIRLHVGTQNNDDLFSLMDFLQSKFSNYNNFYIYPSLFYPNSVPKSICDNSKIEECFTKVKKRLSDIGYQRPQILKSRLCAYSCMADNNNSIVISPDGKLSKCEHVTKDTIIGDVFTGVTNTEKVEMWKIRAPEEIGCESCDLVPICNELKYCPIRKSCSEFSRNEKRDGILKDVLNTYNHWKNSNTR